MKRDMDLARKILFAVEELPKQQKGFVDIKIDGHTNEEINYHLIILMDAGLIKADYVDNKLIDYIWKSIRLTWEGHEFIEAARDNTRWEKAKGAMVQVGGFALDVMKQLLVQFLKEELKLT